MVMLDQQDQGEPTQKLQGAANVGDGFEIHRSDSGRNCPQSTFRGAELYVYPRCLR